MTPETRGAIELLAELTHCGNRFKRSEETDKIDRFGHESGEDIM